MNHDRKKSGESSYFEKICGIHDVPASRVRSKIYCCVSYAPTV